MVDPPPPSKVKNPLNFALFGKFLDTHCNVGQFGSFGITSGVFGDALADAEDHGGR